MTKQTYQPKNLTDLSKIMVVVLKQNERAQFIKKFAGNNQNPFAQVLFYENLIIYQVGTIFEKINLVHLLSLLKNSGKIYSYDLPNFEKLMNSYTLGSIINLASSALSPHKNLLTHLKNFNKSRNQLTHKMFDINKNPSTVDLFKTAKKLAILGHFISSELDNLTVDIHKLMKQLENGN